MLTGNLATMRMRPCGACALLVDDENGCAHWNPPARGRATGVPLGARRLRRYELRPPELRPLRSYVAFSRLMAGESQRRILLAAYHSPAGRVDVGKGKAARCAALRLVRNGLMTLDSRGGSFTITDEGRATHEALIEAERKAGLRPQGE